jgi:hypothetical protein
MFAEMATVPLRLREAVHNTDVAETARLARNVNAWISKSSRKAASQKRPIGRCDGSHDENGERRSLTVPKLVCKGCLISADYNAYARCDQCAAAEANRSSLCCRAEVEQQAYAASSWLAISKSRRYIVESNELPNAFLELEKVMR